MVLQSGQLTITTTLIRLEQYHSNWKSFFLKQKKTSKFLTRNARLNGSIKHERYQISYVRQIKTNVLPRDR